MDAVRFGLSIRALRRRRRWTQRQLAAKAGLSQSAISRAERGDVWRLTTRTLIAIGEALGARLSIRVLWQGEDLDRLLDAAHAGLVERVIGILQANGWDVVPEATFNHFGERGSIDILAWHPVHGALLIVEVKSVVPDMQSLLLGVDRKARIAPELATERGWRVRSVSRLIVLPADRTARRRVAAHRATFDVAYPARTRGIARWLRRPAGAIAGVLFLPTTTGTGARQRVAAVQGAAGQRGPAGSDSQSRVGRAVQTGTVRR